MRIARLCLLCSGCVLGGGPYVAYGGRGFSAGLEAGGGFAIVQANAGIDTDAHPYLRGDVVAYPDELTTHSPPFGGRVGGGVWLDDDQHARGMFVMGAGGSAELRTRQCIAEPLRAHDLALSAIVEIQLRHQGAWLLVLASRFDASANYCERT